MRSHAKEQIVKIILISQRAKSERINMDKLMRTMRRKTISVTVKIRSSKACKNACTGFEEMWALTAKHFPALIVPTK